MSRDRKVFGEEDTGRGGSERVRDDELERGADKQSGRSRVNSFSQDSGLRDG